MIEFDRVRFAYPAGEARRDALHDVSFRLAPGEMLAVLGANGSGKSTLGRLCNGLILPSSGAVSVDGRDTRDHALQFEIRESVGMVFQRPDDQIVGTAVEDDVAFGPENLGLPREVIRARVDAAISAVGLEGLERREPHLLSGGQKQRLTIAGALAMQPRYLVLDEPTSMIDAQGATEVASAVESARRAGVGVLLITHDLSEALAADRALVLAAGEVAFTGPVCELLAQGSHLSTWGLELPALVHLAESLRALGVDVPLMARSPEQIAQVL